MTSRHDSRKSCVILSVGLVLAVLHGAYADGDAARQGHVYLADRGTTVVLFNGLIRAAFSKSTSRLVSLAGADGIELLSPTNRTMHLDSNWQDPANPGTTIFRSPTTTYRLVRRTREMAELSFVWAESTDYPFTVDIRVVMRADDPGYYYTAIYSRSADGPPGLLEQARLVGFFDPEIFTSQAIDVRQCGVMPSPEYLAAGETLDPKEATRLADGSVYCKYYWAAPTKDLRFIGLYGPDKGIWVISPSSEWDIGGPTKQHLTTHQIGTPTLAPAIVKGFHSRHFISLTDSMQPFDLGQTWEKCYGPLFVYINGGEEDLIADAAERAEQEIAAWPYAWMDHPAYPLSRGAVMGKLALESGADIENGVVLLAESTDSPFEWQNQGKDYIHWADVAPDGSFAIENVRPGAYTLYAYADGIFGTFRHDGVVVFEGQQTDLDLLQWPSDVRGRVLWQIGVPDRSAAEFRNGDRPRSWEKAHAYEQDFPNGVHFVIGESVESLDWNYLQPRAQTSGTETIPAVWSIYWDMDALPTGQLGRVTMALAGAYHADLTVRLNGYPVKSIAISEHSDLYRQFGHSQGLYHLYTFTFRGSLFAVGENVLTLTQENANVHAYVAYDAIRLEWF